MMNSVAAVQPRLRLLERAVHQAEQAIKEAQDSERTLSERIERRRIQDYYDSEEVEDDEELQESRDQIIKDRQEYPDEDGDDFDGDAKQRCLSQVTYRRKKEAAAAIRTYVTELETFAKSTSLNPLIELHDRMRATLPIELRHMIYSYLEIQKRVPRSKQRDPVTVYQPPFDPDFQGHPDMESESEYYAATWSLESGSFDALKLGGWLLNPEYVGRGMAREIAEIFYAENDFWSNVNTLEELLVVDRTQTGFRPYEYIRGKLNVDIATTCGNGFSERAWQSTENEMAFLNGVYKRLNHLLLLTRKSEVIIMIKISSSTPYYMRVEQSERRFLNIMEAVRAPIYDLMHSGVRVIVTHHRFCDSHRQSISEGPMNLFRLSKEEWETEKRSHGPDWLPSVNFVVREELEDVNLESRGILEPQEVWERRQDLERRVREALEQRWRISTSLHQSGS